MRARLKTKAQHEAAQKAVDDQFMLAIARAILLGADGFPADLAQLESAQIKKGEAA